jgi:protein ImuB
MPVTQARALFGVDAVRLEPHQPDRDRAALRAVAGWARRFSPLVAPDEPDGLLLDVTGCAAVFGGEEGLLRAARAGLRGLGFANRVAIAPTFGCAWAVARHGAGGIVGAGGVREAVAPLPIAALRVDGDLVEALAEVGIDRVAHLLDMPRSTLPARFGERPLLRLDQALGQAIETIEPVRPLSPPAAERVFDGATDRPEAVELTARELLEEIAAALLERESGAREVEITLERSDLPPERLRISMGRPSRDARHLMKLLGPRLERVNLGFGVEGVRVRVVSSAKLRHDQTSRWDDREGGDPRALAELVDTLSERLGAGRVLRVRGVESHLPERAFRAEPGVREPRPGPPAGVTCQDRPTVLFGRPFPAEVIALTPDGPVHRVRWRGGDEAVRASVGPERIAPEWWRAPGPARDHFAVQTESGRWLWLAREDGRWLVRGVWA